MKRLEGKQREALKGRLGQHLSSEKRAALSIHVHVRIIQRMYAHVAQKCVYTTHLTHSVHVIGMYM